MDALDASRSRPEGSSHGDDLDALEQLAALQPDPAAFRGWLTEQLKVPGDPMGVTLSTVHRVKGMEWPHVVVVAANQGLFPHRLADDVEEERRVFHVAITRCQRHVDVIADRTRTSPFVAELQQAASRPTPPARTGTGPSGTVAATRTDDGVLADVGLQVVLAGGLAGHISAVHADHAVVDLALGGRSRVPFGEQVRIADEPLALCAHARRRSASRAGAAGRTSAATDAGRLLDVDAEEVDEALFEALRAWRGRIASETGVPAYLVFHDRALRVIAARKPDTLRALAGCPGVGPAKLERFGDDVLDIVAAHP
jgi:hypothetical protein